MQTAAESYLKQGEKKGLRRGLKEGRKEGREEGRKEGREQGFEQGLMQGREQGLARGFRVAIRRVLMKRFKRVPEEVEAALARARAETLQRLHEAALNAPTLDAVFPGR